MSNELSGFTESFAVAFSGLQSRFPAAVPARVMRGDRASFTVLAAAGLLRADVAGRLRHAARSALDLPAVGDWVAVDARVAEGAATIQAVLPRRSAFVRRAAGETTDAQVVAANVDTVFVVMGMDGDYNLRRVERYLVTCRESGASPVVVLNKADVALRADPAGFPVKVAQVEEVAGDAPVFAVCALVGDGVPALAPFVVAGATVALVGSSGAGKSTLVNALVGSNVRDTGDVRADDSRGRHTTTSRELVALPGGAWLMDTPGMRELQLWGGAEGVDATFADIAAFAARCRFRDCAHAGEPGCGVAAALESGELTPERFAAWRKLQREARAFAARHDANLAREQKLKRKRIHKAARLRLRGPGR